MGDRCYVRIEVHRADRDKLVEILGDEPDEQDDELVPGRPIHLMVLTWDEANYLFGEGTVNAASAGLRFVMENGPGAEYREGTQVGFAGTHVECLSIECRPVVAVDEDGQVNQSGLANVRKLLDLVKMVRTVP